MKKTISTILVCVLILGSLFTLTSCEVAGFVFGTYTDGTTTYEFSLTEVHKTVVAGNDSVSVKLEDKTFDYKVSKNDNGDKIITFTDGDGNSTTYLFNSGSDNGGSYIEFTTTGIFGVSTKYYSEK